MIFLLWFGVYCSVGLAAMGVLAVAGEALAELGRRRQRRRVPVVLDASPLLRRGGR